MAAGRKSSSGRGRGKRKDEEEFGTGDKARDGEPADPKADVPGGTPAGGMSAEDDELARRRAEKGEQKNGDALADLPVDDGEQEELFPVGSLEGDPKVTLKNIIKAHHRVEYTASLMSAEVPLREGLLDPDDEGRVLVTYEVASLVPVPIREDKGGTKKIVGYKIRQQLRPIYVEPIPNAQAPDAKAG
jgi:hypothetical protein